MRQILQREASHLPTHQEKIPSEYGSSWSWSAVRELQHMDQFNQIVRNLAALPSRWPGRKQFWMVQVSLAVTTHAAKRRTEIVYSHFQRNLDILSCLWYSQKLTNSIKPKTINSATGVRNHTECIFSQRLHWRSKKARFITQSSQKHTKVWKHGRCTPQYSGITLLDRFKTCC